MSLTLLTLVERFVSSAHIHILPFFTTFDNIHADYEKEAAQNGTLNTILHMSTCTSVAIDTATPRGGGGLTPKKCLVRRCRSDG